MANNTSKKYNIIQFDTVTSTNTLLKEMALNNAPEGTVVAAYAQTDGRGRMGRTFHSPHNSGLYFSILLRPNMPADNALFLTTAAAVAVSRAIETTLNLPAFSVDIKWVNDIYINNRKVCGILTEGSISTDGELDYAIVGIGININPPINGFPDDVKYIAGTIYEDNDNFYLRSQIILEEIIDQFFNLYSKLESKEYVEEYRKRSFLTGREVYLIEGTKTTPVRVVDIDTNCGLIVQFIDGTQQTITSGEVSIKITN